ncbi:MAG: MBL fold metallo-hydrolase [Gemmatimonadaceae bacterium]
MKSHIRILARRTFVLASAIAMLGTAASTNTFAQERTAYPEKRGLKLTEFPRLIKLANNVYGYEEIRNPGFTTVSMIVVGTKGVLIADGQGSVAQMQTMLDKIKTVTTQPIKWYVVGSDHGDHTAGNSVLPKGITYVVSAFSKSQLAKDSAIANTPAMTGDKETIDVGGITVNVLNLGRAHTGGDLVVHLPKENILFMSEVYLNRVFPAMRSAYPSEWVATVDKALAMNVGRYVPGHGFIEENKVSREELITFRDALKAVIAEATRLHALGLTAADATKQANWGPYKDWFLSEQQAPIAVAQVFKELEGKLPPLQK